MKQYPYLSESKIATNAVCDHCQKQVNKLLKLEWQASWFRGDDEYEKICSDCISKSKRSWHKQIPQHKIVKLNQTP